MPTCIYCGFSGSQKFPREHVIPYAFVGAFQNALTLGCVCNECNSYFGRHLELRFASESIESVVRYRYGLRDVESAERTRTMRAKVNVPGPIHGAKVRFRPDSSVPSGVGIVYIPQVAFKNPDETDWTFYTLQELTSDVLRALKPGAGLLLFFTSAEEENAIRYGSENSVRGRQSKSAKIRCYHERTSTRE